jgi:methionine-rich copper-binding protein CopC
MFGNSRGGRRIAAMLLAAGLLLASTGHALAHSRYDRSEPAADSVTDGQPVVMRVYFTQELTSKSTISVYNADGVQVDLADGHVDLDDPDRKVMLVSLPALPAGAYRVEYVAESAEDGHPEGGRFGFEVGAAPSDVVSAPAQAGDSPNAQPAESAEQPVQDAY